MDRRSSVERDLQAMAAMTELTRADYQLALAAALDLCALAREAARVPAIAVDEVELMDRLRRYGRALDLG